VTDARSNTVELDWQASRLALSLTTCAAVALVCAVLGSAWQLVAFAAPLLGVLVSIRWQRPAPAVHLHAEPGVLRCFEAEEVRLAVWATADDGSPVELTVTASDGIALDVTTDPSGRIEIVASAVRWGRYPIVVRVEMLARGGMLSGTATVPDRACAVDDLAAHRTARPARHPPHQIHRSGRRVRQHPHLRAR
jgi:uncharacterized protein (DUF58 family)